MTHNHQRLREGDRRTSVDVGAPMAATVAGHLGRVVDAGILGVIFVAPLFITATVGRTALRSAGLLLLSRP